MALIDLTKSAEVSFEPLVFSALSLLIENNAHFPLLLLTENAEDARRRESEFRFFAPHLTAVFFPDWETLPYEHFSPHKDLISERLSILWQLKNKQIDVLIVPIATAMQKLPPVSFVGGRSFLLQVGLRVDLAALRQNLIAAGYTSVSNVVAAGEFAVRGSLLDLFPMGSNTPLRIDFFDDEIDSIKIFNPDTQRTVSPISEVRLLPANEFPTDEKSVQTFRQKWREVFDGNPTNAVPYKQVSDGFFGGGAEYYLPLFFDEECVPITAYLPQNTHIITLTDIQAACKHFSADIEMRYKNALGDVSYPALPPEYLYLSPENFQAALSSFKTISYNHSNTYIIPDIAVNRQKEEPLFAFKNFQAAFTGRILLCSPTLGRRETVSAFFHRHKIKTQMVDSWQDFINGDMALGFAVGDIAAGFMLPERNIAVISENDLYPTYARTLHRKKRAAFAVSPDMALRDLAEIKIGDPVVHESHGIGRYLGLVNMGQGDDIAEMMLLEYADNAKLYVPVADLHLISRYAGASFDEVSLHKLGSSAWSKAKRKAIQKAHDTAAELLQLYALRQSQKGHSFDFDEEEYKAFADGFEYAETEDQAAAIIATIKDLLDDKPMDRLICGDVGFGKTEVALRAAFVAVSGGKQVAVLAPTTLLVEQHTQVFRERFADFAVNVASLSRFNSSRDTQGTLKGLANGTVDIVIGTHKLVQPDIQFKNLGLLIIDEEHRFGVRQKEKLKQLRSNIDVLTMTATPIPRTLSMALDGLRDFSLITTAPERRLAVKTFVKPLSAASIKEAVLRELKRGGQVFFLHNEVDTIENARERLQNLIPEARIAVAHGQMAAGDLERVMRNFLQQQFNVLVCSTIIETGIDIPNANTIIINRADKFGIAQLHQLRGRVGRSHHQAYAYLFTPEYITRDAQKRLDAVAAADELGAGFKLAMEDLEIRGAGEILGEGQSGDILQVGLTLYGEMLKQAVRDLKNGKIPDLDAPLNVSAEIKLDSPALLPETYCPDVHERLVLYKRLAACENDSGIDDIYEELVDRFGLPEQHFRQPENNAKMDNPIKTLIAMHRLRIFAKSNNIKQIDANSQNIVITFNHNNSVNPVKIIELLQSDRRVSLSGQDRLKIAVSSNGLDEKVSNIKEWVGKVSSE